MSDEKDDKQPIHTHIKSDPISTPGYWRLFTTWIMMRYGTRVGVDLIKKKSLDEASHRDSSKTDFLAIQNAFRNGTAEHDPFVKRELDELGRLEQRDFKGSEVLHPDKVRDVRQAYATLEDVKAGTLDTHAPEHISFHRITDDHARHDAIKTAAQEKITDFEGHLERGLSKESKLKVKKVEHNADRWHDGINGGLNMIGTTIYATRVASDIKSVFAEAVAYEKDKKPSDIGLSDLVHSDNKLVNSTIKNYVKYNTIRYASDMAFFVRFTGVKKGGFDLTRANGTDLAMAVKGALLSKDILTKQTTFFEDTIRLIDTKLNPIQGLGQQVNASDVTDLYQKYALEHKKDAAFKHIDYTDIGDTLSWRHSEPIFNRVAELMNNTYHYKNPNGQAIQNDDFALPKYLYLLGHDLIDLTKPKETLALVEIANAHGMEAVKETAAAIKRGISIEDCLNKFPVPTDAMDVLAERAKLTPSAAQRIIAGKTHGSMAERAQASLSDQSPRGI